MRGLDVTSIQLVSPYLMPAVRQVLWIVLGLRGDQHPRQGRHINSFLRVSATGELPTSCLEAQEGQPASLGKD